MKAWVLRQVGRPLEMETREPLTADAGQAVVALRAAALNRRDWWMTQGQYPGLTTPVVLGSDGAGTVEQIGKDVDSSWLHREVVINPGWEWGDVPAAQSDRFRILGMPTDGTFATHVQVPATYLYPKPAHLDWGEAAALPLGGVTAYRGLFTQGSLRAGERVLITGIGGGVASMALLFAKAQGAQVYVTSSKADKRSRAERLGAGGAFDYHQPDWHQTLLDQVGPMHLVFDGSGGPHFNRLLEILAPGGRLVNYGITAGSPPPLELFRLFWKQLRLIGSTMGSPDDFRGMMEFVSEHRITPCVDREVPFDAVAQAVDDMKVSPQFGKIVVRIDA